MLRGRWAIRKLSEKRKWYLDRHCRLCRPLGRSGTRTPRPARPRRKWTWTAPTIFEVTANRTRRVLVEALARLRQAIFSGGEVCLDFSKTERMHADGTLLFLAELRRAKKHTRSPVTFNCIAPASPKVSQVLEQIGVFELIGAAAGQTPVDDDVVSWKFAHGHRVEGQKYEDILAEYDGEIAPQLRESLYNGITEAMTNVTGHAYELRRQDGYPSVESREWWMFSQAKDGELTVVICDLGAGIPRTLPLKQPGLVKRLTLLGRSSDAQAIDSAVKLSMSRTALEYRGKGLGQIARAVAAHPRGEMAIHSNRGAIVRKAGAPRFTMTLFADSILGTLIYWKLPLEPKENP